MAEIKIIKRECDKAMKRSKERCKTPDGIRWRCDGDCKNCICCIATEEGGNRSHMRYDR